ncbi:GGDEF domain-containing protein [Halomonas campisalis]|uniref:GGDEF domain-containing protein n=1 Tax=Billgrantia campisalis TaxID=74661 RepID=A0ABS9P3U5_9GAMM|nr:GGDEF domain-containing protein [Halomonas campisalis]MCG6656394.1 GGDEF domain-containing protein [Halomonas campisalis]MDR5861580.1 GGDEF domain-containing protein [Halomonas campisalis]
MAEDNQWSARRFAAAYAAGALLVAGYAFWHYLMGDYQRILVPAVLALLMLFASLLRLALPGRTRLSAYLVLIAGYLMLGLELPNIGDAGALWIGLAPLLTLLLLPLASAMLLNVVMVPIWLVLLGEGQLDTELALGFLALMVVATLIPWEQHRQQALFEATDPRDPHCSALTQDALRELLASEFQRTELLHQPLAALVIHLPQLEMAGEQFGPRSRQTLIDALCREANRCSRRHDFLGRQGPASFWLVLPDTSESGAQLVQQRIKQAVEQTVLVDTGPLQAPMTLCQRLPGETWPRFEQRLLAATRRLADA